jgi:HlyD family secretion protein
MASVASPRKRAQAGRRPLVIGGAILAVLIVAGLIAWALSGARSAATAPTNGWTTADVQSGTIDASVSATGTVEARATAELRFAVDGTITEVLVRPGDRVTRGQPLARLDPTDLQIALDRARAQLAQAQADEQQVLERATPQEIAQAKAQLAQAQAQYRQVAGSVSKADIDAARARLEAAKAQLAALEAGNTDLRDAANDLARAEAQFASQRDQLSLNKTNAQFALDQAVNDLTRAQAAYATAKQNWEFVNETGRDPNQPEVRAPNGQKVPNKLSATQRQQYYDTFVQAEAALRTAESNVQKAQVNFDQARQAEVVGVEAAQRDLQAARDRVSRQQAGGNAGQIAQARAAVQEAQAALNKLTGGSRAGDLDAAQAGVAAAQAALEKLTGDPSASALARAQAGVAVAQSAVKQAERDLARATLTAPFDGTIARVELNIGEKPGQNAFITIADLSSFHVDVPVDELDVAQLKVGQPVKIALDALPDRELTGQVTNIEPLATKSDKGTNTYTVQVTIDSSDAAVRPGMTASAQIITQQKGGVVLVPRRAVLSENGKSYVLIPSPAGRPDPKTGAPPSERREVTTGLSNSEVIEITSGLKPGEKVLVQGVVSTFNPIQQNSN